MRILVLRGGALGDFLLTLPALRALRARWPDATIELVGNRRAAELAVLDGTLQAAHDQQSARWAPLYGDDPLPLALHGWLKGFDVIINFWPDPERQLAGHFRAWGERFVSGSAHVTAQPAARQFVDALRPLGCSAEDLAPRLELPVRWREEAKRRIGSEPVIALHAGSGSPRKTWPLQRWQTLAKALPEPILWIQGEADQTQNPPRRGRITRANNWPLPLVAAALAQCRCYVGHDTGISHLAAAAGASGVLLFGPTDPSIWAPPTDRFTVVRDASATLEGISVERVLAALRARWEAR